MNVNYTELIKNVKGTFVQKPLSGTLSGHSAGEPFDKHNYEQNQNIIFLLYNINFLQRK